jgi:glyoxylase-like metal-dependent hydrolase (beta-lactamase superfamily II)
MNETSQTDRLYFRQLLSGQDVAIDDQVARQMVNFIYLIGDRETGEALVVDAAYSVGDILDVLEADDMVCTGLLVTHYHADHIGGSIGGWSIEGADTLLERVDVPVHVQRDEVPWVKRTTGLEDANLVAHDSGDVVKVGQLDVHLVHTPGHTPGSQCFLVEDRLVSGDTLFLDGCGRTDLPGSDPEAMYESLTTRLAAVPDDTVLFPGHRYSPDTSAPMSRVRRENFVLAPRSAAQWMAMFGR